MPVTPGDSSYRNNRRIAGGQDAPAGEPGWRPQFGSALTLFGQEVTLGPEHLIGLAVIGVLGGVEAAMATVVLFLGYLYLKANPFQPEAAEGQAGGARSARKRRAWKDREPGVVGAIKYFFGPLPEGPVFSAGEQQFQGEEQQFQADGTPVEAIGAKRLAPGSAATGKGAASKQPAAPAVDTAADKARSAAAREAAAKRAMERAAAAAQQEASS